MAFDTGPTIPPSSFSFHVGKTVADAAALLPSLASERFIAFAQRCTDLWAAQPPGESVRELSEQKVRHEARVKQLLLPRAEGGLGEAELATSIVTERRQLERVTKELRRLNALKETRTARWTTQVQLQARVINWITAGGVPGGCALEDVPDAPEAELLRKGERVADAIERHRHRLRECAADGHRARSAPYPSADIKAKLRPQIEALAEAGRPNVDSCIEHNSPLAFATTSVRSQVYNAAPGAVAFSEEAPDVLAFVCFLMRSQVIARIEQEIDAVADDKAALSAREREIKLADIAVDALVVERQEVALLRIAEARGEVIDYRHDTSPQALLGVRLITSPLVEPGHGGHSFTVSYGGR